MSSNELSDERLQWLFLSRTPGGHPCRSWADFMDMVPEVPEDEAAVAPPPASGPHEDSQVQLAGFLSAIVVTAFHSANPSYESLAKADDLGSLVAVPQALEMLLAKVPLMSVLCLLLTAYYSLLTTHYSLLTTHYSLLTTHY